MIPLTQLNAIDDYRVLVNDASFTSVLTHLSDLTFYLTENIAYRHYQHQWVNVIRNDYENYKNILMTCVANWMIFNLELVCIIVIRFNF